MDDLLKEFLSETVENLGLLDSELVRLEQNPDDPTVLQNIFRIVHTIKGTCGFLGLPCLQKLAHAAENVLGQFRDVVQRRGPEHRDVFQLSAVRAGILARHPERGGNGRSVGPSGLQSRDGRKVPIAVRERRQLVRWPGVDGSVRG